MYVTETIMKREAKIEQEGQGNGVGALGAAVPYVKLRKADLGVGAVRYRLHFHSLGKR